jgi:predicted transcriptional regulator
MEKITSTVNKAEAWNELLAKAEKHDTEAIQTLAKVIALSTLKTCLDPRKRSAHIDSDKVDSVGSDKYLTKVKNDGYRLDTSKKDASDTMPELADLVSVATVAVLENLNKYGNLTATVKYQKPQRQIVYGNGNIKMIEAEAVPIQLVYRAVRKYISGMKNGGSLGADGYSYIAITDTDTDTGIDTVIYRRLGKYADIGGYTSEGLYTVSEEDVTRIDGIISRLDLTREQKRILSLRQGGYSFGAIADILGVTQEAVKKAIKRIRCKAVKIGFEPTKAD